MSELRVTALNEFPILGVGPVSVEELSLGGTTVEKYAIIDSDGSALDDVGDPILREVKISEQDDVYYIWNESMDGGVIVPKEPAQAPDVNGEASGWFSEFLKESVEFTRTHNEDRTHPLSMAVEATIKSQPFKAWSDVIIGGDLDPGAEYNWQRISIGGRRPHVAELFHVGSAELEMGISFLKPVTPRGMLAKVSLRDIVKVNQTRTA